MFESAEVGSKVARDEWDAVVPQLRVDLLNAQFDLKSVSWPVVLLLVGDDFVGANAVLRRLHEWLDARYMMTNAFGPPTEEERERPPFWRYWRVMPPDGTIGIYAGAWALNVLARRLDGEIDDAGFERRIEHIRRFEGELADDGALVLKFWIHLPKDEYRRRLKRARKDPVAHWQIEDRDWRVYEVYDEAMPLASRMIRQTSTDACPWTIVEGTDDRHRDLTVTRALLAALQARLAAPPAAPAPEPAAPPARGVLDALDLSVTIERDEYGTLLDKYQSKIARRTRRAREKGLSSVLVFEGWDAAGKGGVIRRITGAMSVTDYTVVPIAAPSEEERVRHYLWRFWRLLPRAGRMLIFDRSWYGRVLVERVEGFARAGEWHRAYAEINDFEAQLVDHGMVLAKFWLHIDPDEQLGRFEARAETAYKKYKLTDEDYRNREQWSAYTAAVNEMVARTSTEIAPWHLVAANDKRFARIEVLRIVSRALNRGLKTRARA